MNRMLVLTAATLAVCAGAEDRAAWMKEARWGVMTHFLAEWIVPSAHQDAAEWNKLVDNFDVKGLAGQLASTGAGYYLITMGQNSGFESRNFCNVLMQLGLSRNALTPKEFLGGSILSRVFISLIRCHL
ncbi:MAG: hypothetical protein Q8N47_12520 [Bryobacterales bacterium]|nr:hypothetical protein [Bryobacterales bacterium]